MLTKYYVQLTEKAPNGDSVIPYSVIDDQELPAVILESNVVLNGTVNMVNINFLKRVTDNIRQTKVFASAVTEPPQQRLPKTIDMTLSVKEDTDNHQGQSVINLILAVVTYGILLLFLQWKNDFKSEMTLTAKRWDGQTKQYTVRSSGSVGREAFADHSKAITEMIWQVTNNNLNALMNQVIADSEFYLGN